MATKAKQVSFQERLRRGLRKLDIRYDVRTVTASEIISTARGLVRGNSKANTAKLKSEFDKSAEKKSAPVQVSIAKRNFREDGTGCEMFEGAGRPSDADLGYGEDAA
jgi:hypothetical protein